MSPRFVLRALLLFWVVGLAASCCGCGEHTTVIQPPAPAPAPAPVVVPVRPVAPVVPVVPVRPLIRPVVPIVVPIPMRPAPCPPRH